MKNTKAKPVQMGLWAAGLLLSCLLLPIQARSQEVTPCPLEWYYGDESWLPVNYYDTDTVMAYFLVPLAGLESLVPHGVSPLAIDAPHSPWKSLGSEFSQFGILVVAFLHHQSVQYLDPYWEEMVAVVVEDASWDTGFFPMYVTSMTLTSEPAVVGGILNWGFPKIFGDVHYQPVKPKGFKCFCSAEDGMILNLEVATDDHPDPTPASSLMLLTTKEGYLVRTAWVATEGTEYASFSHGKSTVHLGQHPIARQLRAIGLELYYSIGQVWSEHVKSGLPRGMCQELPALGPVGPN